MLVSKKHSTLDHCEWPPETMTVPPKCMAASASLKWQRTLNRNICQIHDIFAIFVVANILYLYQDDNTPFVSGDRLEDVFDSLENALLNLFHWFSNNQMKANLDKCHLLLL